MHPPKWGFTALKAGSTISFLIDTRDVTRGKAAASQAQSTAVEAGALAGHPGGGEAGDIGGGDDDSAGFMEGRNSSSLVEVSLAHLRSYEHMGMASVSCSGESLMPLESQQGAQKHK